MNHLLRDPRTKRLWAALNVTWWGNDVQVSDDNGRTWQKTSAGLGFAEDRGLTLKRIWHLAPDRDSRPQTLWCGVDPGALFRSDDDGGTWQPLNKGVRATSFPRSSPRWASASTAW